MRKSLIIILVLGLLVLSVAVAPAMALGPDNAADPNPNVAIIGANDIRLTLKAGHIDWINTHGVWTYSQWFSAGTGAGKENNAFAIDWDTLRYGYYPNPIAYQNEWIFLSPEGSGPYRVFSIDQKDHGGVWWFLYINVFGGPSLTSDTARAAVGARVSTIAAMYPDGVFYRINFVQ